HGVESHEHRTVEHAEGVHLYNRKTSTVVARCDEVSHRGGHRAGQAVDQTECRVALCGAFPQLGEKHQYHSAYAEHRSHDGGRPERCAEEDPGSRNVEEHHQREHHRHEGRGDLYFGQVYADVI